MPANSVSAKDIVLKPIDGRTASDAIRRLHYSHKIVRNSQLHIGVFLHGNLEGAMQFGPSLDKRKIMGLVDGTEWSEFLELNRLAFSDRLPRNSESRALSVAMKLIRKYTPQVKWIISFADATMCGDGTIYRAAGFDLTGINKNYNVALDADGVPHHKMTLESQPVATGYFAVTGGKYDWEGYCRARGWNIVEGFQLRYIYFLDRAYRARLKVPILPYDAIQTAGAGMYKGAKR
jgi:hypothetical protein